MNDSRRKSQLPSVGGAGQHGRNDENATTAKSIACSLNIVNPFNTCQAQAGPVVWSILDAIHTVVRELLARGLVEDGPAIDQVITASWAKMGAASYLTAKDREAWATVGGSNE